MDELNSSIVENLKNKTYFVHAREWYVEKFLHPIVDRTYLTIAFLVTFISFMILLLANQKISTGIMDFQYISYTNNITDKYAKITELGQKNEDPQFALESYLCKLYVKNREQYDYNNLETQSLFIQNNSSAEISKLFLDSISINNPNSPVVLYQNNLINEVEIISANQCPRQANCMNVSFTLRSIVKGQNDIETSKWLVRMEYDIEKIEQLISSNLKNVNFKVNNYEIKKLR